MNDIISKKHTVVALISTTSLLLFNTVFSADVEDIRVFQAEDYTRVVFDLSEKIDHELFMLDNPERVVVDFKNTKLALDVGNLNYSQTPIKAIRSGTRNKGDTRIVIDLGEKMKPSSFTLAPNAEIEHRLVVDLYNLESKLRDANFRSKSPQSSKQEQRRDIVVAISAGHGGDDPGSIGFDGKIKEKDVTLAISKLLQKQLEAIPGYQVVMVRDSDYYVQLRRRPQIARDNRADLFVAIHADWYRSQRANGATIYALSGARADRENARRVAEKENGSDLLGGVSGTLAIDSFDDDVALTLVSFQMDWSMEQSQIVGTKILDSLDKVTHLRRREVQQASFQVLNSPDIPSILIETGYLTNPDEARRLISSSFQQSIAQAIAQGITNYFVELSPEGTLVAWQNENGLTPMTYIVENGDSLSMIALKHSTNVESLMAINELSSDVLQIGQKLKLNEVSRVVISEHTIRSGETLSEIAVRYSVNLDKLRAANNLRNDKIFVGQVLKIPTS